MTGHTLTIQRDGTYQDLDIAELTDDELDELEARQPGAGWQWAKFLAAWIRDHARERAAATGEGRTSDGR